MPKYKVHTKTWMYTIECAYFVADGNGVMFFDENQNGIGFAPNTSLQLVKLDTTPKPTDEQIKEMIEKSHYSAILPITRPG